MCTQNPSSLLVLSSFPLSSPCSHLLTRTKEEGRKSNAAHESFAGRKEEGKSLVLLVLLGYTSHYTFIIMSRKIIVKRGHLLQMVDSVGASDSTGGSSKAINMPLHFFRIFHVVQEHFLNIKHYNWCRQYPLLAAAAAELS